MGRVLTFRPKAARPGTVTVEPIADDDGSWGVFHTHARGETFIASHFAFDDAVAEAKRFAAKRGARFDSGSSGGGFVA